MKKLKKLSINFISSLFIVLSMYLILKYYFGFEEFNTGHLVPMIVGVFIYVSLVPFPNKKGIEKN